MLPPCSLDRLFEAALAVAEMSEPVALMIARVGQVRAVRVVVGREVVCHVEAGESLGVAVGRALDDLEQAIATQRSTEASSIADAACW